MNSINFCYWLQGARELCLDFNPNIQKQIILNHLNMVFSNKGKDDKAAPPYLFCKFLESAIESGGDLNVAMPRLNSIFRHHIDKLYPNDAELARIHNDGKDVTDTKTQEIFNTDYDSNQHISNIVFTC